MKWLGLTVALAGCTHVVWLGHSDDRRQTVQVIEQHGLQFVRVDDVDGPKVLGVPLESLHLAPRGTPVYAAQRADGWVVLRGTSSSRPWQAIGDVVLSETGAVAYVALSPSGWVVVTEAAEHAPVEWVKAHSLAPFDAGWRWVGGRAEQQHVFVNGQPSAPVDHVSLVTSHDTQVRWVGHVDGQAFVFTDGRRGAAWKSIASLLAGAQEVVVGVAPDGGALVMVEGRALELGSRRVTDVAVSDAGVALAISSGDAGVAVCAWPSSPPGRGIPFAPTCERLAANSLSGFDATKALHLDASGAPVFAARRGADWFVEHPGWRSGPWVDVANLAVEGTHVAFLGVRAHADAVVIDGVERAQYARATSLAMAPDGSRVAWLATVDGTANFIARDVNDGGQVEHSSELTVDDTVAFAPNGRAGCVAGSRQQRSLHFLLDDGTRRPLTLDEVVAAAMRTIEPEQLRLRRWVRAELMKDDDAGSR